MFTIYPHAGFRCLKLKAFQLMQKAALIPDDFLFLVSFLGKAHSKACPWVPLGLFVSLKILWLQTTEISCGLKQKRSLLKGNEEG